MVGVSVVVATRNPGAQLPAFVRALDAQTLPAAEFELVVVDDSTDGSADRLRHLADRRPNVTVLPAEGDRLSRALDRATGERVLVVTQDQRLAPRALELLLERARRSDADVVLGRVVRRTASGSPALPDDADRIHGSAVDPTGCIALVRRSLPDQHGDLPALLRTAGTVGVVGRYAAARVEGEPAPSEVAVATATCRWADGVLHLSVEARLPAPAGAEVRAWLVLDRGTAEIALPATAEATGSTLTVAVAVDPRTAEGGLPLEDGPSALRLRIAGPAGEATVPLTAGPSRPAVIAGRPYLLRPREGGLQLDAGATRGSVIGATPASRTSVVESAHGALVALEYPDLPVHGDAVLPARLQLGGLALPARLVCRDGRARLEAYVGSLPGTSTVKVVVGGGDPVATRLRLRADGVGAMTFEPVPPKPPGAVPLAQRLRRRLPGAVEPVVRRLAAVPVLRGAYRRAISR